MPRIYLPVEDPIRQWLRVHDKLRVLFSNRIFFGTPRQGVTAPWITLARVSGGPEISDVPEDHPLLQFDVWGLQKDRANTEKAAALLATVIDSLNESAPIVIEGLLIQGAVVTSGPQWMPDIDSDRSRYLVQARFTVIAQSQRW